MKARKNVNGLIKLLGDRDAEIREASARALGELGFPRVIGPLCRALTDTEWMVRISVIEALAMTRDAKGIEALVEMLKDEIPAVAQSAAKALVSYGPQAVNSLARVLTEREPHAREQAVRALGQIQDERVIPALSTALNDAEPSVRNTLAVTLGKMGEGYVIPALCQLLQDTDPAVVQSAIAAIEKIGLPANPLEQAIYAVAKRDWVRAVVLGSASVESLTRALRSTDEEVRREAARSLGLIGDSQAIKPLTESMQDERWFVRETAALALGRIKDPGVMEVLISALRDNSAGAREAAAKALGEIGDPRAIDPLINVFRNEEYYLKDDEYYVCEAASDALVKFGMRAVEPMITALKDSRSTARHYIARALDKTGVPQDDPTAQAWYEVMRGHWDAVPQYGAHAIDPLIAALIDDDHRIRRTAAETLGKLEELGAGVRAIPALCDTLRDRKADVRRAAAEVLVKFGQPAVDSLIYSLNDEDPGARQTSAWALGMIGDPWCLGPLCDALHDQDSGVALAAAEALDLLGVPDEPEVLAWYAVARQDWEGAAALGDDAIEPLSRSLKDISPDVRWSAARALGVIGNPGAADILRNLLNDDVPYVREAAAHAIGKIIVLPPESVIEEEPSEQNEEAEDILTPTHIAGEGTSPGA
jgi:HEAT repeat protein